jgi:hypothetical protein
MKAALRVLYFVFPAVLLLLLVSFPFPTKTVRQNDSAAIGRLRELSNAQLAYAARHPTTGFACRLSDLSVTSSYSGYTFQLQCDAETNGIVAKYHLTAEPLEFGRTGTRAYCMTESRVIWYDQASGTACLGAQRQLER